MENWSFPDHKSDFKADQKIRKAMFSAEERSFEDLGVDSKRKRPYSPDFSLRLHRGQVSFLFSTLLAVNPGTLVPNVPI